MKRLILMILAISILAVSLVSAFWPFTGNVVDENTPAVNNVAVDEPDLANCHDSDGGIFPEDAGAVSYAVGTNVPKQYIDECSKNNKSVKEYYCKKDRPKAVTAGCKFGCKDGACIVPPASCTELPNRKGVSDEWGKKFMNKCDGTSYTEYSCDGTSVEASEPVACPSKCNAAQGGCFGLCHNETDVENDKDVQGLLYLDNKIIDDKCGRDDNGRWYVTQYKCENSKMVALRNEYCGTDRECTDFGNGGMCRDLLEETKTIKNINDAYVTLKERVRKLEASKEGFPAGCSATYFATSSSKDGNAKCKSTNAKCLLSGVSLILYNVSTGSMVDYMHKVIPCDYEFKDFNEHLETDPASGLKTNLPEFEVICCSA